MNKNLHNQQAKPEQYEFEVQEMCIPKPGNWPSVSKNTGAMQQIITVNKLYLQVVKLRSNMKQ